MRHGESDKNASGFAEAGPKSSSKLETERLQEARQGQVM